VLLPFTVNLLLCGLSVPLFNSTVNHCLFHSDYRPITKLTTFPHFDDDYLDGSLTHSRYHDDGIYMNENDRRVLLEQTTLTGETELSGHQTHREELQKLSEMYRKKMAKSSGCPR
jgi:hypothetical protein